MDVLSSMMNGTENVLQYANMPNETMSRGIKRFGAVTRSGRVWSPGTVPALPE